MNVLVISGRLTKAPELRSTSNGIAVATFNVAVDRPGIKDKADFIDCVAWRSTAEFVAKWFKKGDPIEVQGPLTTRIYEDKNGNKRKVSEVVCDRIMFTKGRKKEENGETSNETGGNSFERFGHPVDSEDIPF